MNTHTQKRQTSTQKQSNTLASALSCVTCDPTSRQPINSLLGGYLDARQAPRANTFLQEAQPTGQGRGQGRGRASSSGIHRKELEIQGIGQRAFWPRIPFSGAVLMVFRVMWMIKISCYRKISGYLFIF